jgi:deazaflavin-dependent oxidoreductase (nitroreductase family)
MAVRNRTLIRIMSKLHMFFYRLTGGALGGSANGMPILLLTHKGRKTGALHTTPLMHLEDEGRYVVIASNAAAANDPAWWTNLKVNDEASIQVKRRIVRVRARAATGDERARLWGLVTRAWDGYREYQESTAREIPVVLLEPLTSS